MLNLNKLLMYICLLFIANSAFADEGVTSRQIVDIGCHITDGTCYVTLSGSSFGQSQTCTKPSNEFRFDGSTTHGKRAYATLYAAFLAKKSVDIVIQGCYPGTGYLNLHYYHVH